MWWMRPACRASTVGVPRTRQATSKQTRSRQPLCSRRCRHIPQTHTALTLHALARSRPAKRSTHSHANAPGCFNKRVQKCSPGAAEVGPQVSVRVDTAGLCLRTGPCPKHIHATPQYQGEVPAQSQQARVSTWDRSGVLALLSRIMHYLNAAEAAEALVPYFG